jgi:hypothetical protein
MYEDDILKEIVRKSQINKHCVTNDMYLENPFQQVDFENLEDHITVENQPYAKIYGLKDDRKENRFYQ